MSLCGLPVPFHQHPVFSPSIPPPMRSMLLRVGKGRCCHLPPAQLSGRQMTAVAPCLGLAALQEAAGFRPGRQRPLLSFTSCSAKQEMNDSSSARPESPSFLEGRGRLLMGITHPPVVDVQSQQKLGRGLLMTGWWGGHPEGSLPPQAVPHLLQEGREMGDIMPLLTFHCPSPEKFLATGLHGNLTV